MEKLHQLRQRLGKAIDELEGLVDNEKAFTKKEGEIRELQQQIARAERAQDLARDGARPGNGGNGDGGRTGFKNFGEWLLACARAESRGAVDDRLQRAPLGAGETDPAGGGFLVDMDFANTILTRAYDMGAILSNVFKLPISGQANGIKIPGVDETSRATGSRWGGVQAYWVGEGDGANATKPKFRLIELDLKKLMATWYVTDEMMGDAVALATIANQAFAEEIMFMLEDSILRGTGAGMPLGILNAPCKYKVAAEKGQPAGTFLWENVLNMWASMWARSRKSAAWYINQEIEPQLYQLRQVIGTGGVPVYLPPGGASEEPYGRLLGRPVIPVEYCEAPGTEGDVVLADFSQYVMADKNSMQQASSIHVRFLTDETTFRITYRCDGEPIWHNTLTPYKGTGKRSPFITLANR